MKLIRIYQCLCDETRLRILNLLTRGPLCVCHLQDLLGESQVKISKHLAYLKEKGVVQVRRHQNWMIYSLPAAPSPEMEAHMQCLQDCVQTESVFRKDAAKLKELLPEVEWLATASGCCAPASARRLAAKRHA